MKRMLIVLLIVGILGMVGCGEKSLTIEDVVAVYVEAGVAVDQSDKPLFSMIGAIDGVMFKMDEHNVKIYEFKDAATAEKMTESYDFIIKGNIAAETYTDSAKEIFNSIE